MKYDVIVENSLGELTERVNGRTEIGWRPLGGVAVGHYQYENTRDGCTEFVTTWAQAIVYEGE